MGVTPSKDSNDNKVVTLRTEPKKEREGSVVALKQQERTVVDVKDQEVTVDALEEDAPVGPPESIEEYCKPFVSIHFYGQTNSIEDVVGDYNIFIFLHYHHHISTI